MDRSVEVKRAYRSKGLLGYKVLIDGFNNTFDAPNEPMHRIASGRKSQLDQTDRCIGFADEERAKILEMQASMKQFRADEQQLLTPHTGTSSLQKTRHPPLLAQRGLMRAQLQAIDHAPTVSSVIHEAKNSSLEVSNSKRIKRDVANPVSLSPSSDQYERNRTGTINEIKEHEPTDNHTLPSVSTTILTLPPIQSMHDQQLKMEITRDIASDRRENMSSTDAYMISSARIAADDQQRRIAAKRARLAKIGQAVEYFTEKLAEKKRPRSPKNNLIMSPSTNPYLPLPARQLRKNMGPIQSRIDLKIQQATVMPYESYARESIQQSVVNSLREAGFFRRKSWLQKVEISQEMVRRRSQRCMRPADETKMNGILSPMRAMGTVPSPDGVI